MKLTKDNHPEVAIYSGEILHKRFAYRYFKKGVKPQGDIIAFRAPAKVEVEGMIDLEDVLSNDYIYSQDMIHFLYEIPILEDRFGAVAFQRLFNTKAAFILSNDYIKAPIIMKGDDMMVHKEFVQNDVRQQIGKASVSIVHVKDGATLGHTAINNIAGKQAPVFAYSCYLSDEQVDNFMSDVIDMFYYLTEDIFVATTKIIS
jgi:hypothetical protein